MQRTERPKSTSSDVVKMYFKRPQIDIRDEWAVVFYHARISDFACNLEETIGGRSSVLG